MEKSIWNITYKNKKIPSVLKVDGKRWSSKKLKDAIEKCSEIPSCKGVTLRKTKKK